jgi:threonine dehydrogenase-like Zn-dependent dehydrogenase
MLAVVTRRNNAEVVEKPVPRLQSGWALVRMRLAGICNTDIEILRGYHNFQGTLGHEFVGEVVRGGGEKDRGWIGRRVVGEINLSCEGLGFSAPCGYCRRAMPRSEERRVGKECTG